MNIIKRSRNISWENRPSKSHSFKVGSLNVKPNEVLEVTVNVEATSESGIFYFQGKDLQQIDNIHCYLNKGESINTIRWSGAQPYNKIINPKEHIIFLRVAWMKHYRGVTQEDLPRGAGWYVNEYLDGGEVYNFLPVNGYYYGFSRIQRAANLRLERLQQTIIDNKLENVTVVMFAKHPTTGSVLIVGYYNNAILHRNVVDLPKGTRGTKPFYLFKAKTKDCKLFAVNERRFELPADGPGQSNVWYGHEYYNKKFIAEVKAYLENPDKYITGKIGKRINHPRWQVDAEKRKQVELAAMEVTADYFTNLGYDVKDVHQQNLGWDMEANRGEQKLLLEVKGLSGQQLTIELSANEYTHSKKHKSNYRICIVNNALDKEKRELFVFANVKDKWIAENGIMLTCSEKVAAIFNATSNL